jgi:N-acetylmuramoyl-L-alanine amidase
MPAALVETAFLSNLGDAELLKSPQFLQKVATALADGVADYASLPAKQSDASYQDPAP